MKGCVSTQHLFSPSIAQGRWLQVDDQINYACPEANETWGHRSGSSVTIFHWENSVIKSQVHSFHLSLILHLLQRFHSFDSSISYYLLLLHLFHYIHLHPSTPAWNCFLTLASLLFNPQLQTGHSLFGSPSVAVLSCSSLSALIGFPPSRVGNIQKLNSILTFNIVFLTFSWLFPGQRQFLLSTPSQLVLPSVGFLPQILSWSRHYSSDIVFDLQPLLSVNPATGNKNTCECYKHRALKLW